MKKITFLSLTVMILFGCSDTSKPENPHLEESGHKELVAIDENLVPAFFQHVQDQSYNLAYDSIEHQDNVEIFSDVLLENTNIADGNDAPAYYSFLRNELILLNTEFSGDSEAAVGSSGDISYQLFQHRIEDIYFDDNGFIVEYGQDVLNLTIVSEDQLEDTNGSIYQLYDINLEDIYQEFTN